MNNCKHFKMFISPGILSLHLKWEDKKLIKIYCDPDIEDDVNKWINYGLLTLIRGTSGFVDQLFFPSEDSKILDVLKIHLENDYNFICEVKDEENA